MYLYVFMYVCDMVFALVGVGDSKRTAVTHVGYFDGRRVGDSKSSRSSVYSCRHGSCGICQRGGRMSKMRICECWIAHANVSLARARKGRINGLGLRGHLR